MRWGAPDWPPRWTCCTISGAGTVTAGRNKRPPPLPQIDHVAQDAGAFQPEDMNWKPFLADYDVVVLAINEIFLRDAAWGFPSRLGEVLAKEP